MPENNTLERPAFFGGQRLTAADLTAAQRFNRELRWLHNQTLHDWGIALGYGVSGAKGEQTVSVQPGFALDQKGRELLLTEAVTPPIPPVAGTGSGQPRSYYLTLSYLDDGDLSAQIRQGECDTSGAVRLAERAALRWQEPASSSYREGLDVILAAIQVQNCRLAKAVSLSSRRLITRVQPPSVAAGHTPIDSTEWKLYPDETNPIGVYVQVSTAAAAFQMTPRYQVQIIGDRMLNSGNGVVVIDGYVHIGAVSATGFEVRMLINDRLTFVLPGGTPVPSLPIDENLISTIKPWYVTWIGMEG